MNIEEILSNPDRYDSQCQACIASRRAKFGARSAELKCSGIKKNVLDGLDLSQFDSLSIIERDNTIKALTSLADPVTWLQIETGTELRWYQQLMARCTAINKMSRVGRRAGKCLHGDTKIHLANGSMPSIKDLVGKQFLVRSFDGNKVISQWATAFANIIKPAYKVTMKSGRDITASFDHPFLSFNDNWINVDKLKAGDRIATERSGVFGNNSLPDYEIEFLALMIGDGGCSQKVVNFTNNNPIIVNRMKELASEIGCIFKETALIQYQIGKPPKTGKYNKAIAILKKHGVMGKLAKHKVIPEAIFSLSKIQLALFLNRLYATDGWASVSALDSGEIGYCSASKQLARDIQELLFKFGITAALRHKPNIPLNGKLFEAWTVTISNKDSVLKFAKEIGILGKQPALDKVVKKQESIEFGKFYGGKTYTDTLPKEVWAIIKNSIKDKSVRSQIGEIRFRPNSAPSRNKIKNIGIKIGNSNLVAYAEADIIWDIVDKVEFVGDIQTYDITVNASSYNMQNFSAEGIFVHNSVAMAAHSLHKAYTTPNFKILVIAPLDLQVEEYFRYYKEWIGKSTNLRASIKREKQNPHLIEFTNGSRIMGLTAGTKSGHNASSARGQEADAIYLDESDYLSEGDLETILVLLLRTNEKSIEDKYMWASSTPTGKRQKFYEWAHDPGYKEFHYPSMISPAWNAEEEIRMRKLVTTENGWTREVLADWGEEAEGVYRDDYIDRAVNLSKIFFTHNEGMWDYKTEEPTPGCLYIIGVDWNSSGNGVQIVVAEHNPALKIDQDDPGLAGRFRIATRVSIEDAQFTQTAAIDKILELNIKWNPSYIYVDEGYGACVAPNTLVQTKTGSIEIQNIKIGDQVLTHKGQYSEVLDITGTPPKESYSIRPSKCPEIVTSYCHPFLALEMNGGRTKFWETNKFTPEQLEAKLQWVQTENLSIDKHLIAIAKSQEDSFTELIDMVSICQDMSGLRYDNEYVWLKTGYSPITGELVKHKRYIDPYDKKLQELLGWYLSEGSANKTYVEIDQAIYGPKYKYFRNAIKIAKNMFPNTNVYTKIARSTSNKRSNFDIARLIIPGQIPCRLFEFLGGKHCNNKMLHPKFMGMDISAILKPLYYGDGHLAKKKKNANASLQISLTSPSLIMQVRQWFINHSILPSLYKVKNGKPNCFQQWRIDIGGTLKESNKIDIIMNTNISKSRKNAIQRREYIETPNYMLVPISKFKSIGIREDLMDIEVADGHSFCGNGVILHNTQIETLRRIGNIKPETGILKKLEPINFSSMQEIRDPVNKAIIKKEMKPFMVNNSISFFEKNFILLNGADEKFIGQLRNYKVLRRTDNGRPVYEKGDDHILDAWNLCLLGFAIKFTDLGNPQFTNKMAAGVKWGDNRGKSVEELEEANKIRIEQSMERKKPFPIFGRGILGDNNSTHLTKRGSSWDSGRQGKFRPTRTQI